jgi:hypothetical protein
VRAVGGSTTAAAVSGFSSKGSVGHQHDCLNSLPAQRHRCWPQAAAVRNKDLRRRLTGFSVPVVGGGASWATVEGTKASARRVLTFLEDRRVLFNPYWAEQAAECVASVIDVRRMLTDEIGALADDETLVPHLQTMRAACRQFPRPGQHLDRR